MAAVRRFRHRTRVGKQAAGARRGDADGVGQPAGIELHDVRGRHRGAERTCGARRMKAGRARRVLSRCLPDPALHLDALDERSQDLAPGRAARLGERERAGERRR